MVTAAVPPLAPYAADAHVARLLSGTPGASHASVDRTRTLVEVSDPEPFDEQSVDRAVLACAAQLLGAGERVLADSVTYVGQRQQFGRAIGSYQAIKHQLADVRIALDFARPVVFGAALGELSVSAAKVAAADAAYLAARTGLQVHGAIGYTAEFDLSLWLLRIRALVTAWGTPAYHRGRVLDVLTREA
jgi:alkylation response protein AidB-like acyl-CoA dehydrogenase